MSEKNPFQSFEELIDHIVVDLKDSEILMIKNADPVGVYYALDRWVKSEFLDDNIKELVSNKILEESSPTNDNVDQKENIHPDDISGFVIQGLISRIKG